MRGPLDVSRLVALTAFFAVLCLARAPVAFAIDFSSQDFIARDAVTDNGSGQATSTDYFSISSLGQIATGVSTSSSFQVRSGTLDTTTFSPEGGDWRWYSDAGDETPVVALAGENVAPAGVANDAIVKLRWTLKETEGVGDSGVKFLLQYSTSSAFTSAVDVTEQGACSPSSEWCYANGAGTDNALVSTNILSDSDSCVSGSGTGCGTHNESGFSVSTSSQAANAATEYEFTVEEGDAAPADTVYFFRAVQVGATSTVPLEASSTYPSVSTEGGTLSFTIGGVPAATSTAGVVTSVTTTSTSIPFGALTFGTSTIAANQLTVTTNASGGYEIYAYEQQQLTNQYGANIPSIPATNASPAAWSSACMATSTGCWGYHTSASVLAGGSTRFAPDDSYAQFNTQAQEVGYSSGPATDQSTDMVYRLEANDLQNAGDYTTNLVYIITPVF